MKTSIGSVIHFDSLSSQMQLICLCFVFVCVCLLNCCFHSFFFECKRFKWASFSVCVDWSTTTWNWAYKQRRSVHIWYKLNAEVVLSERLLVLRKRKITKIREYFVMSKTMFTCSLTHTFASARPLNNEKNKRQSGQLMSDNACYAQKKNTNKPKASKQPLSM